MIQLFSTANRLSQGLSYWQVGLDSGKIITEGQVSFDLLRGTRNVDWALDIVGSGDNKHIRTLTVCTPQGDASLPILEDYTAFQLKLGTQAFFSSGEKIEQAQIIGRVDDRESGACTAVIWDVMEQRLYIDHMTSFRDFAPWRENVVRLGPISTEVTGVRLL